MSKTAVILFNLGGPDSLSSVRPFLFNLFNDPAVIRLPQPIRAIVAFGISLARAGKARAIYQQLGGKSPILENTALQAEALQKKLGNDYKVFPCMRHWHPMSGIVAKNVKAWQPDRILLLPLYPQYSTTTTGSAFADWERACRKAGLDLPTDSVCCYPADLAFIAAHVALIREAYWKASENGAPRVLFSAHGLPESVIDSGDPYADQVEKTAAAIVQVLAVDGLDSRICYQSRVGPKRWIGPSTSEEIIKAGADKVPLLVVPISFVSEHSETLVELDIEYRELAEKNNVPGYWRVPALGTSEMFIEALAGLCQKAGGQAVGKLYCSEPLPCLKAA